MRRERGPATATILSDMAPTPAGAHDDREPSPAGAGEGRGGKVPTRSALVINRPPPLLR